MRGRRPDIRRVVPISPRPCVKSWSSSVHPPIRRPVEEKAFEEKVMRILITATLPLALGGCIASTALDVVTLPVQAAGVAVDATSATVDGLTISQSEPDQKRRRQLPTADDTAASDTQ